VIIDAATRAPLRRGSCPDGAAPVVNAGEELIELPAEGPALSISEIIDFVAESGE
jgi:hypothetical protein